jgi:hypothetical protein
VVIKLKSRYLKGVSYNLSIGNWGNLRPGQLPQSQNKTTPKFGGCEFLFMKNLITCHSDLNWEWCVRLESNNQAVLIIIHVPEPDYFMDIIQTEARKAATM